MQNNLKDPADGYNFVKVMPLSRLTLSMSHGLSHDPNGGVKVLYAEHLAPSESKLFVTRSTREWMNSFVESTESMFKELTWELTLEGK